MDLPPSHRRLKAIYYFKALVDAVLRTPPVFVRYCNSCPHVPSESLQVMTGNCHVRFLEGRASAMGSGYSIVFFIAQSKQNRYQGDTRTPSPRLQPGHVGYIYPSRHSSEAASAEQRHSSSPGVHNGCWLRPVRCQLFLICACSKWRDRCENTAASMKCIRVDAENCSFFVPI